MKFLSKASDDIPMRDDGPSIIHNNLKVLVFQPHTFKVKSIGALMSEGGMKWKRNVVGVGFGESFTKGEGECIIPWFWNEEKI